VTGHALDRVRVVHAANGTTRAATFNAPSISVQYGHPHNGNTLLVLRDEDGVRVGAAWYRDTSHILAGTAIDQEMPG
jgi:hypothetical protein